MENVISLIGKIIAYLGGASVIILSLSTWIGKIWANVFVKQQGAKYQKDIECYKSQLSEQLELLKAKNEKVNYISKTQFDVEFKIYQELSESSFSMLFEVSKLFPTGLDHVPQDAEERQKVYQDRYEKAQEEFIKFQNKLFQIAPFIVKEIYDLFDELRAEARLQVVWYPDLILHPGNTYNAEQDIKCWERSPILIEKHSYIIEFLRKYLNSLKVVE